MHFYYYMAELHGRTVRLNVAKDVEELHNGVNLECKVMVRQTGLYLYTMRIRKEN